MKKLRLLYAIILIISFSISAKATTPAPLWTNDELYTICKTWGLMKYYHPYITQGKLDWDKALLEGLTVKKKISVDELISGWIKKADEKIYDYIQTNDESCKKVYLENFNTSWIGKSTLISAKTKAYLEKLPLNQAQDGFGKNSDRYIGKDEKRYEDKSGPEYRLLSLFRFWNVIEYYYAYKQGAADWNTTLKTFIPTAIAANTPLAYAKFLSTLGATLKDTHTSVSPEVNNMIFGDFGAPFKFRIINGMAVVTKVANIEGFKQSGLVIGDVIATVNNIPVKDIIAKNAKYIAASNTAVLNREAYSFVFNGDSTAFKVTGTRKNGTAFSKQIMRVRKYNGEWDRTGAPENKLIYMDTVTKKIVYSQFINKDVFYIERASIENTDVKDLITQLRKSKAVIFDLRSYNDLNASATLRIFNELSVKPTPFSMKLSPDLLHPGKFCFIDYVNDQLKTVGIENKDPYKGKVFVLIDEDTQSAEEFFAMIFKTIPGVVFIGSQTAGADGNITPIKLADNHTITMSGFGVFYPDGTPTQRVGIKPDVNIRLTIKDIQNGKDTLVEKALELAAKN